MILPFCLQDDVVMGTLSVRENLHFSAALRLPSHMTHAQRKERVEKVIDELGLRSCASTKVWLIEQISMAATMFCLISLSVHLYCNVIVFCEWEPCAILSYLIIVNANSQTLTSLTKVIYVQKIVAL